MSKKVIILGAGPIGVEAALQAASRGFDVEVFERDQPGSHVLRWGHVRFFSPWGLNCSELGRARLKARGLEVPAAEVFPTGAEFVSQYLEPLAHDPWLEGKLHTGVEVLGVSRAHARKGHFIGKPARAAAPFLVMVREDDQERYVEADIVIDTTGAYGQPNALGLGGLPALGERAVSAHIERYIPDVLGAASGRYEGKRVLVVGAGYSAITSIEQLLQLKQAKPETTLTWLVQGQEPPYEVLSDDPLPQRRRLAELGNDAFVGQLDGVTTYKGARLVSMSERADGALDVHIEDARGAHTLVVDELIANVGYRPDLELYRELQVHLCYASEGPMKLAAALLAASGGGGDCLAQTSQGVETLMSPEPGFFVLGAKSYGRGSAFLLKIGYAQAQEVFDHLDAQERAAE